MGSILLAMGAGIVVLIVWMIARAVRLTLATAQVLRAQIEPALAPLREGRMPSPDRINALAANVATRSVLWRTLRDLQHPELFPAQYNTAEALAESDVVVWLMHGNELGAVPDSIELVKTIALPAGRYFVFRFRTNPPHWAASKGWMAGVTGPWPAGEEAPEPTPPVFSKFEPFEQRSAEDHLTALMARAT